MFGSIASNIIISVFDFVIGSDAVLAVRGCLSSSIVTWILYGGAAAALALDPTGLKENSQSNTTLSEDFHKFDKMADFV